tara:strand:+ start:2547 stop:5171 length:2625 start_codon:yes stop_codon:yes gene_type:complete
MRIKTALFFCILSLISSKVLSINIDDERGDGIDLNDKFLPVVYLKIGNSVCTGVLFNHRSILTAAHCLKEGEQVTVYTGNSVDEEKDGLNTSSFIKNPEVKRYDSFQGASYDLAIISLSSPLTSISPYAVSNKLPTLNDDVYLSGYGLHGTGSSPDTDFDRNKRWGSNVLSIIADEHDVVGISPISETDDQIILGYYFDKDTGINLESSISLGDSGSPLLLKIDETYEIVGIASWIRKSLDNQDRGYGASAGYSSVSQNIEWIRENNPLKNVSSIGNGAWEDATIWDSNFYPSNFYNVESGVEFNQISARYYEVNLSHNKSINSSIELDELTISSNGNLEMSKDSLLNVLLDTTLNGGSITNHGTLTFNNLIMNNGNIYNSFNINVSNNVNIINGELNTNGTITGKNLNVDKGIISGSGSAEFLNILNSGTISPGSGINNTGQLEFIADTTLTNNSTVIIDVNNNVSDKLLVEGVLSLDGSLHINSISNLARYSGNTSLNLFSASQYLGSFSDLVFLNNHYGLLRKSLDYKENGDIDLKFLNPLYGEITKNKSSENISKYIDTFTLKTSTGFQEILNSINYLESNQVSEAIENLIPTGKFNYQIELLNFIHKPAVKSGKGLSVSDSNFNLNGNSEFFNSDINQLNLHGFNFNFSIFNIDSSYSDNNSLELIDSKSYQLGYFYESKSGYIFSGSYFEQDNEIDASRSLLINQETYKANRKEKNDLSEYKLSLGKDLNWDAFSLQIYAEWTEGTINSDPFIETLNGVNNLYDINAISYRTLSPSILLKKNYQFNDHTLQVSSLFQSNSTKLGTYINNLKLDVSEERIQIKEEIKPFEDSFMEIKLSYLYKKNIYSNYSYSKKGDADMNSIEFGLLF